MKILYPGQRFGRLTIVDPDLGGRPRRVRAECDCGKITEPQLLNVTSGNTKSCGCLKTGGFSSHPLRGTWYAMIYRCESPQHRGYPRYGGRGIRVCDRWHDFRAFAADIERDIGPRPAGLTLDRVDNDGHYEPGNVRWATWAQQAVNSTHPGKRLSDDDALACLARWQDGEPISALAREHGVHNSVMNRRLHGLIAVTSVK